jgi:hypothetical protein
MNTGTRNITVVGEGRTTVHPDTATVEMGVRVSGASAREVLAKANKRASSLVAALRGIGVAADDIATSHIGIHTQYNAKGSAVTGFEAANDVRVTVREIARAGEIIDGAASMVGDAIAIHGISFSVADPEAVMALARAAAIENARKRAGEYARAAGLEVGDAVTISEVGTSQPGPMFAVAARGGAMPISAGTTGLSASVTVVFELIDRADVTAS